MIVDKETFFKLQGKIPSIPFTQSQAWIENMYPDGLGLVFFVNSTEDVRICCAGRISKKRFVGRKLSVDGLCTKPDVNATELRKFFTSLCEEGYEIITLSDIESFSSEFELAIRRSGFIRPLGLLLCPMTMYVDTQEPFHFHRNWKRNVKRSIENGNQFEVVETPSERKASDFVRMFNEQKERKGLSYGFSVENIRHLMQDSRYKMFLVSDKDGYRLAGRIVFISGNMAYDVYASNSYEGMRTGAIYQVQEGLLSYLHDEGVEHFDYGRIPPSSDEMDDIYLAKSYSGGYPVSYNGEWVHHKSLLLQYILSFRLFFLQKQRIY